MKTIEEKLSDYLDSKSGESLGSPINALSVGFEDGYNFGRQLGIEEAFEWISTKNNLPEENIRVLVKLKGGKTDVASLISFPDMNHEDGKRMYWRISISTMYWFDEVECFRYINLEDMA